MCHEKTMMMFSNKLQRGFSLLTAIFLLVVLGGLGTMMVTFFVAQQQSSTLDVMGSRAYQASRAGIEWAAYNISATGAGVLWPDCATYAAPATLFAANTLAGNLSPFNVTLNCIVTPAVEGGIPLNVYELTSTADNGAAPGSKGRVERVISVKMWR
jgi:MSHA biogenesis protein MshP